MFRHSTLAEPDNEEQSCEAEVDVDGFDEVDEVVEVVASTLEVKTLDNVVAGIEEVVDSVDSAGISFEVELL